MNAFLQAVGRRRIVDILVANVAYGAVAFSFGAIATASGLPAWVPILFSAAVFAGGSQFAALSIVMSGGSLIAATVTALAINARMLAFGVAIADVFAGRLRTLILGAHLIVDVSAALALDEPDPIRRRAVFWFSGLVTYSVWVAATVAGALTGQVVGNLDRFGLDTALPLVLLAPIASALRRADLRRAALAGAALALAVTPLLPPGYPILVGLGGLVLRRPAIQGRG